jgi:sugar lactone lactonase YvrE
MTLIQCALMLISVMIFPKLAAAQNPPNPYREVPNFARLPEEKLWGHVFGVGIDSHNHVWVLDRCGGSSCVGSSAPALHEFDAAGKHLKSIGEGLFVFPHSLMVDKDDNLWVADCGVKDGRGNQVFKVSPQGKVLLTLGKKGVLGGSIDNFVGPTDVTIAPNGDIFVADGHAALALGGGEFYGFAKEKSDIPAMRILRFSKDGKFIKAWGKEGRGPGEFDVPHGIAIDSTGRIFVADRGNNRVQIFDQDGKYIAEWKQFGKPCGIFIDAKDTLYVADSDSNGGLFDSKYSVDNPCATCLIRAPRYTDVGLPNPQFTQGVRIGSAKDGIVKAYIPPQRGPDGPTVLTERVSADAMGNVYMAEGRTMNIRKYAKK